MPCCGECDLALQQLIRLEELIQESQRRQRDIVERLKLAKANGTSWGQERNWNGSGQHSSNDGTVPDFDLGQDADQPIPSTMDYVDPADPSHNLGDPQVPELKLASNSSSSSGGKVSNDDADCYSKIEGLPPPPPKLKGCFVRLTRLRLDVEVDNIGNLGAECNVKPKSNHTRTRTRRTCQRVKYEEGDEGQGQGTKRRQKSNPLRKPKKKLKQNKTPDVSGGLFLVVAENLLLLESTLVRYSPSATQVQCLEPGCAHVTEAPCSDYFFAFNDLRTHILQSHYQSQLPESKFQVSCPICETTFSNRVTYRRHLISEHTPGGNSAQGEVVCESCGRRMRNHRNNYMAHVWLHKSEEEKAAYLASGEPLPRRIKSKLGASASATHATRRGRPPAPGFQTSTTNMTGEMELFFLLNQELLFFDRIFIRYSATELICGDTGCAVRISGTDYFAFEEMAKHARRKSSKKNTAYLCQGSRYSCLICDNASFDDPTELRNHILEVHSPPAVCTSCWRTLPPSEMGSHIWSHMNPEERASTSGPAGASSLGPGGSKPRPPRKAGYKLGVYKCPTCPKDFPIISALRAHEKTHLPRHLRPHFNCPECGKELISKLALKTHLERIHHPGETTAERKRECPICSQQFYHMDGERYRIHMRSHTGETPWVCEFCGAGFTSRETYKEHLTVHSDARPFQCEYCAGSFKLRKILHLHQRTVHKDLVQVDKPPPKKKLRGFQDQFADKRPDFIGPKIAYPCELCGKVFSVRSSMTKHMSKCHSDADVVQQ